MKSVKFFDLVRENKSIENELSDVIKEIIYSGSFILGKRLDSFEKSYRKYIKSKYCLGVGNGLDALQLSLRAIDLQPGDEVIVPAHTFIATWLAVSLVGGVPVPVEPDDDYNISTSEIRKSINTKTKAIIAVHLYGRPSDMSTINEIAFENDLWVIEDSAQAHGSMLDGKMCGNLGNIAAHSFYPIKNLGAIGDAGAITTSNKKIYEKLSLLRNYGSSNKYKHEVLGINSRLDEIQAAVLELKLKYLDKANLKKQKIANVYFSEIFNPIIKLPKPQKNNERIAWHQFVIRVKSRKCFRDFLEINGVETLVHYPIPPHKSGVYKKQYFSESFPKTSKLCSELVSLPIYSTLREYEIEHIVNTINSYNE